MCVSGDVIEDEIACRRWDGIGSRGQVVAWLERMSFVTSSSESAEKVENDCVLVGAVCLSIGEVKCELMAAILSSKNVAKSLAVKSDEAAGGGGQRRDVNVLNSMRELVELLILSL